MGFLEEYQSMMPPKEMVREFLRVKLKELVGELKDDQVKKLGMIFPKGFDGLENEKLESVINLCNRTIARDRAETKL